MRCAYCNHENPSGELYCGQCGMKLDQPLGQPLPVSEPREVRCENCGVMNPVGASMCKYCNQPLGQPPMPAVHVCPRCGFDKNPSSAKFCLKCGINLIDGGRSTLPTVQLVARLVLPTMREIVISEAEKMVGRADFLEDLLPENARFISREHVKITFENGKYYIRDEKSANGTKVNGFEIRGQGKKELKNNDEIVLANTLRLIFRTE